MKRLKEAIKCANNFRKKIQPGIILILCFIWKGLKKAVKSANSLRKRIQPKITPALYWVWKVIKKLIQIDITFFIIGIIINSIVCKIFPQFTGGFPVLCGWFDGCVQFNLFIVKSIVNGVYAIFEDNWTEYCSEFCDSFHEMINNFVEWVNNIRI